jgi:hypothetical protein
MNSEFEELLQVFAERKVRYLVVGGYAVIHYTQPRWTKDLDLWVEPSLPNARRLLKAFHQFGLPLLEDLTLEDFAREKTQFMIGVPPCCFDFLTSISGLKFAAAWKKKNTDCSLGFPVHYLNLDDLIAAKQKAGRTQDLEDLKEIRLRDWTPPDESVNPP